MNKELARDLISAGVHFGHGVSRWNPKMKPFIYGKRSKIHIIDVKETLKGLILGKRLLVDVVSSGKDVVFVGTKRQAKQIVAEVAEDCGMHYVDERWLGGMLTNFKTIRSRLKRLDELETLEKTGEIASESKKQASRLKRELRKIRTNLGGVREMNRMPGAMVVVDAKKEHLALREAEKLGIATIGIIDTDSDPDAVDVAIPANDDSIKAIEILIRELGEAVKLGKTVVKPKDTDEARGKSKRRALASATAEQEQPAEAGTATAEPAAKPAEKPAEQPAEAPEAKPAPAVEPAEAQEPAKTEEAPKEEEKGAEEKQEG
ncbi:30S ribosomal protein S2 [Anaerohalosphaera lusitana]|uniref:Small ribosomal subunit protein uS2 n=1 Tax=Anaerohalosphaera lusitana TaxID=1936003 RepID=A0A1U9NQH4_9BACT|nr:30S ribosomal protein S2 [Anaerohalosphaera lusitana]AQT70182.1 30S ribosomal protein S2 [Anaerohalosphaera lusitana]